MSGIERKVAKSSLGTRQAAAARASVARETAAQVVARSRQLRMEKSRGNAAPK